MAGNKKNSKKNTKSKKEQVKAESESPFFFMIVGWFLFAFGIVLFLGSVSSVYSGTEGNWLGPFFGRTLPDTFSFIFGRLPVVLLTAVFVLWGLFISIKNLRVKLLSFAIGSTLLTLDVSCLLSAWKNYNLEGASREVLSSSGGILGHFLCRNVFASVFGTASCVAPVIILLVILVLIFVLSFGLRPRHFSFLAKAMRWFSLVCKRRENAKSCDSDVSKGKEEKELKGLLVDDETLYSVPDGYKIKDRDDIRPFKVRRGMQNMGPASIGTYDETVGELAENPFALEDEPTRMPPAFEGHKRVCDDATVVVDSTVAQEKTVVREDPEILRLEQQLRENERHMSALQIKEIKDKIAEIRRARDILNWEKAHQNRLVVKGAVRGDDSAEANEISDAATVAFENIPGSADAEDLQATRVADATISAVESNDDTFTPVVYGAEQTMDSYEEEGEANSVGMDESYVPPNSIGTSGTAASIPQPDPTAHYDDYRIPSVDEILDAHAPQPADYTEDELNEIGRKLEEKLENFKVKGKVVGCETGPVITRFEVEPGPGVKVSQFSALQDDLAMALKATSIRILTPIPGKGAVGIEIPNRKIQTIFGRDIFESEAFKPSPEKIMMALGKDISGEPFSMDLAKAPHLMIAGQTGSGKSVCINALMASMLFSKTPDELRMILVDPKAVELKMYENIPHLLAPVITKPEVAIQALQWLCYEMDRRTEVLAKAKVRNLLGFNEKFEAGELPEDVPEEDRSHRMAFIVVIIDEMADLMMVAGKEIEKNVSRLAAKARAVGIHLVLATQRPSVKVITGNIKANLPTRISFKVASQVDARTVMDHAGAEKLLGRGDMLFKAVNAPDPIRVHGAFLSDEEAEKLADACSNQNVCYPQLESFDVEGEDGMDDEDGNAAMNEKKDKLLFEVAKWAIECGNGLSTSAVQRHFSVGYSRAGKIVDQLYGLGVCGRSTGNSKPRALLIDYDQLLQMERSGSFG